MIRYLIAFAKIAETVVPGGAEALGSERCDRQSPSRLNGTRLPCTATAVLVCRGSGRHAVAGLTPRLSSMRQTFFAEKGFIEFPPAPPDPAQLSCISMPVVNVRMRLHRHLAASTEKHPGDLDLGTFRHDASRQ